MEELILRLSFGNAPLEELIEFGILLNKKYRIDLSDPGRTFEINDLHKKETYQVYKKNIKRKPAVQIAFTPHPEYKGNLTLARDITDTLGKPIEKEESLQLRKIDTVENEGFKLISKYGLENNQELLEAEFASNFYGKLTEDFGFYEIPMLAYFYRRLHHLRH